MGFTLLGLGKMTKTLVSGDKHGFQKAQRFRVGEAQFMYKKTNFVQQEPNLQPLQQLD